MASELAKSEVCCAIGDGPQASLPSSTAGSGVCCEVGLKGRCSIEAIVPVDEKGQIVLPKGLRDSVEIKAGDKLAVVLCRGEGGACCILLMRAEDLKESLKKALGPMFEELLR